MRPLASFPGAGALAQLAAALLLLAASACPAAASSPMDAVQSYCLERSQSAEVVAARAQADGYSAPTALPLDPRTAVLASAALGVFDPSGDGGSLTLLDARAGDSEDLRGVQLRQCSVVGSDRYADQVLRLLTQRYGAPEASDSRPGTQVWAVRLDRAGQVTRLPWVHYGPWREAARTLNAMSPGDRMMTVSFYVTPLDGLVHCTVGVYSRTTADDRSSGSPV